MSKLPKAPLIEVIFELRWALDGNELQEAQNIPGDYYHLIKDKYPYRETINSNTPFPIVNIPTHRFRTTKDGYPLLQVGLGLLAANVTDEKYFWDDFSNSIIESIEKFKEIYSFENKNQVTIQLQYIDFIEFNFNKNDIFEFLNKKLHLNIEQNYFGNKGTFASTIVFSTAYALNEGVLNITINKSKNPKGVEGITINTLISNQNFKSVDDKEIKSWLNTAHETTSSLFKKMTEGELYESFKLN